MFASEIHMKFGECINFGEGDLAAGTIFFGGYLATEASDGPRDPSEDLRRQKLMPQMPGRARDLDYASSYEEKSFFS